MSGIDAWTIRSRHYRRRQNHQYRDHTHHCPRPPWFVEQQDACFVVIDSTGQKLAYVYYDDPRAAAKPLTRDEARRIAVNIAKLREP